MLRVLLAVLVLGTGIEEPPDPSIAFREPIAMVSPVKLSPAPVRQSDGWPAPPLETLTQPAPTFVLPPVRHRAPPLFVTVPTPAPAISPNDIYRMVDAVLATIPAERRAEARFLTSWPLPETQHVQLDRALRFWLASLSNRRQDPPPRQVPGLGWLVYLSDYGWDASAWEALAAHDPYFAVSVVRTNPERGWIDPVLEYRVRTATNSVRCMVRGDRFLALTGTDVGGGGFYSKFLQLPDTEPKLFKKVGIDEQFLKINYLLRGGAVLGEQSIVARHNRELQLLPSPFGLDARFLWRSLDTLDDVGPESVLENFIGTLKFAGKEFIGSNKNGTHWYYLANAQNKQVSEVPTKVAQDHFDPHDATVVTPYKCVSCHGPKNGIRHFDDVISRMSLNPQIGLAVITKGVYRDNQLREALEDYYLSPLAQDIDFHQDSYRRVIEGLTGLTPQANAENFVQFVNAYLYEPVTKAQAARELGVDSNQIDAYLKQTGNEHLLALLVGEVIPRKEFEGAFADGMRARIYPWERSPRHDQLLRALEPGAPLPPPAIVPVPDYQHRIAR